MDSGKFDKAIYLGDMDDGYDANGYGNWLSDNADLLPKSLLVLGNHDTKLHSKAEWYVNAFNRMRGVTWGSTEHLYYCYDNAVHKVRLICINANLTSTAKTAQQAWVQSVIESTPEGWTYFLVQHHMIVNPSRGTPASSNIVPPIALGKIACDTKFGSAITGHWHNDDTNAAYGFVRQDILGCDTNKIDFGWTPSESHDAGTIREQAVTIISIDTTAKKLYFYRIGWEDSSSVTWTDHKREVSYAVERGAESGIWPKNDGTLQAVEGAKMWMEPQSVDPSKQYYIYHEDGTDLDSDATNYNWFEYDADGRYIGRSSTLTQISSKVYSVRFGSQSCRYVIKGAYKGDDYVLSDTLPE